MINSGIVTLYHYEVSEKNLIMVKLNSLTFIYHTKGENKMELIYQLLLTGYLCFTIVWIAWLQTKLNIANDKLSITQSRLEDLEFLYDLRK